MTRFVEEACRKSRPLILLTVAALATALGSSAIDPCVASAQNSGSSRQSGTNTNTSSGGSSAGNSSAAQGGGAGGSGLGSAVTQGQTNLYNATGTNGATATQDSFNRSIVAGTSTGADLGLTLEDALSRGLRQNLGIILQNTAVQNTNGQRLEQLQALLPTVTGAVALTVEQVNLRAVGLKFNGIKPIVGPFQVVDARAYLTQNLVNLGALQSYLVAKHNFAGSRLTAEDARDMVALTVGNAYLLCVADAARIEAVNAELKTSKVTLDQAIASHDAGTSPRLDVLRAQVDYQNEQQNLISSTNTLAKDKLTLARAIGLPLDQPYHLADTTPFKPLDALDAQASFQQAVGNRKDLQASSEQVKAAEAARKAAIADQYPVASVSGDYGDIGTTFGHSHGTFTATAQVSAPIFQVARTRGERQVAEALLAQAKARLADQTQQVNADVRDAILDIQTAAKLVEATRSNVALATEALAESQQRFHEGISDNLPVSEAQSQLEQANDQYISALYQHNVAKLSLARALGVAQTNFQDYLGKP